MATKRTSVSAQPLLDLPRICLAITEHAPLPMATVEGATHIVRYGNPAFCRLMGQPMEQFVGKALGELLPAKDQCVTLLDRVFRTGAPETYTEEEPSRPHPVFWSYTIWPVRADEGLVGVMIQVTETAQAHEKTVAMNQALVLGSLRQHELTEAAENLNAQLRDEIAERKQAEKALRQSEARLEAIVTQATAGIAELDLTGRFTLVNECFCATVGRTPAELHRLRSHDITHPDDQAATTAAFATLAQRRGDISLEKRYLRPDGTSVWVNVSLASITDSDGRPQAFVEISRDIAERKRLETALKASETYFRELTQNLPLGVWTSLPDGQVDFANRHWLDYTGVTFEDGLTQPETFLNNLHPDDRARAQQISAAALAAGEGYVLEARFREAKTGHYRWFREHSVPISDASGKLQKRIGFNSDIDDLKRAQKILADHAGELEAQVRERTGELREIIDELEAFSYSVSHDMRSPLRAMQGFASMLLQTHETSLDASSVELLRRIRASASRMDGLISDVLTYSRLLRSEMVMESINLDELVRQVIATYPQLQADGAVIAIAGTLPSVLGNEANLTQCVSNLLSNAVKFVAPGTPARVTIRAEKIEGDVRLWIEDNGIGIDPKNQGRIWNIFTQVGRARDYQGTGIGLAIVRKAAERMNGSVGLESTPGQGSKFWLRLREG